MKYQDFQTRQRELKTGKKTSSNFLRTTMAMGLLITAFGQCMAFLVAEYQRGYFDRFIESAELQRITIERISKDVSKNYTRRINSGTRKGAYRENLKTVYKIKFSYIENGTRRTGGLVSPKVPFFETGDVVEAWVVPVRPSETRIVGLNDTPVDPGFIHLLAAGGTSMLMVGFVFFAFVARVLIGGLNLRNSGLLKNDSMKIQL